MPDGTHVEIVRLTNANGVEVRAMTYGAIIVSIRVPDREGTLDDVVLGFDDLDQYVQGHPQFGTVVGRYANRIAGGQFTLDNQTYTLARNNGPNHLHGGIQGFEYIFILTRGGPGFETTVPGLWMYFNAFSFQRMGYACAIGVLLFAVILGLTLLLPLVIIGITLWLWLWEYPKNTIITLLLFIFS